MSIHVALHHRTTYRYDRPVMLGPQSVRLRPAPHCRSRILAYALNVRPEGHFLNWQQDPQSNWLARLVFPEPARELRIEVDLVAEMSVINPFDFFLEPSADNFPFRYDESQLHELAPYLQRGALGPRFKRYLDAISRTPTPTVDFLVDLNLKLSQAIRYIVRMEPGVQTPEETLSLASGSCRDTGWLLVQLLRHLEIARRALGDRGRLHRPACVVRSLPAGCGLGRPRPDLGPVRGRGPHPARLLARSRQRRADHRRDRDGRGRVFAPHARGPRLGSPARHQALHRRAVEGNQHDRQSRGRRAESARRAPDHGRRTDLRVGRSSRRCRVVH
jgi:hypothetical protein